MTAAGPVCLDVTRLLSRVGRGPCTGIDRVELAYLDALLSADLSLAGLARTATGYVWLDRAGLTAFRERLMGRTRWGEPDALSRLARATLPERKRAEADLRRLSVDRSARWRIGWFSGSLPDLLRRSMPPDALYLNVGHSNLSDHVLRAIRSRARVVVFLHDTIPLDWPATQRPGTVAAFRKKISALSDKADLVICPSASTAADAERYLGRQVPRIAVVPPGFVPTEPAAGDIPPGLLPPAPYFLCVGTIDPRKRQGFLVDVWRKLGAEAPPLVLAGSVGWCDKGLEQRLARLPDAVTLAQGLSDGAIAALLEGASALVHPSVAEGFGFTLLDADSRGIPVIAADLPVYRETLGDNAVYLPADDLYQWAEAIKGTAAPSGRPREQERADRPTWPTWDAHLKQVLTLAWQGSTALVGST